MNSKLLTGVELIESYTKAVEELGIKMQDDSARDVAICSIAMVVPIFINLLADIRDALGTETTIETTIETSPETAAVIQKEMESLLFGSRGRKLIQDIAKGR